MLSHNALHQVAAPGLSGDPHIRLLLAPLSMRALA